MLFYDYEAAHGDAGMHRKPAFSKYTISNAPI